MPPRPSRRAVLSVLALTPVAGCLEDATAPTSSEGDPGSDADGSHTDSGSDSNAEPASETLESIADRFDCDGASRPAPDVEAGIELEFDPEADDGDADSDDATDAITFESVGSADYPEPPSSLEESAIRTFLADHEGVYQRNERVSQYDERLTHFDAKVDGTEVLESADGITTMRVELHVGDGGVDEDHGPWEGHEPVAAVYAIDETGLVRAEATHSDGMDGDDAKPLVEGDLLACFE